MQKQAWWGVRRAVIAVLVTVAALCATASASAASAPVESGRVSDSTDLAGVTAVAVSGHYAFAAAYASGQLTSIDISNPITPVVVGSTPAANSLVNATNVTISGNYAYVVSKNRNATKGSGSNDDGTGNSLTIVDISNPAAPTILGSVHDPVSLFGSYGVAVSGNYAYVAAQGCVSGQPCPNPTAGNSFAVVDVSSPAHPRVVATLFNSSLPAPFTGSGALDHATSVALSGNYAYVTAAYSNRLTAIDISNPLNPTIVSSRQDATRLDFDVDVATQGNYAYVADQSSAGLAVVDISNPAAMQIVGTDTSAWLNGAYRVRVKGAMVYIAAAYAEAADVVDVSNPAAPRLAAGLYDPTYFNATTGVAVDPTGQYMLMTSPELSSQGGTSYPPYPNQPGGRAATGTVTELTLDPKVVAVAITASSKPPNPTTQTTASFAFATSDTVVSMQCQLDGSPLGRCTSPTTQQYGALGAGSHTFLVQATDAGGNTATASYTWVINASTSAPQNKAVPSVSGAAVQGSVLTATQGTWTGNPAPTFGYQWMDCDGSGANCSAISLATGSTYTLASSDVGSTVEVVVKATNSQGSSSASSLPTSVVAAPSGAPQNKAVPTVTGSAVEAQVLTAQPGTWTGSPAPTFAYKWSRCDQNGANCAPISSATNPSYTVIAKDVGSTLQVAVTGSNSTGSSQATSSTTPVVTSAPGPVTPILDNFNVADNSGPPDANWSHLPALSTAANTDLFVTSQQITGVGGNDNSADYYNAQQFGPDSEVYVTVAKRPAAALDNISLGLRYQNPSQANSSGYQAMFTTGNGGPDQYKIVHRTSGQSGAVLATASGPQLVSGDKLLFRAIGTTLELWRQTGTTWTRLMSTTDSSIQTAGYLSLVVRNGTARLDDFGGGTLP